MSDYSPWGKIQYSKTLADGITGVSTASHGGIKLDRKRNAAMPDALRIAGGWYEEDCEWSLVALAFPDVFKPEQVKTAHQTAKDSFPERYEQHFGVVIPLAESYAKREKQFKQDNANKWVAVSAWGHGNRCFDTAEQAGPGEVLVAAAIGANMYGLDRTLRYFIVPADAYKQRSQFGFVIDETKHRELATV